MSRSRNRKRKHPLPNNERCWIQHNGKRCWYMREMYGRHWWEKVAMLRKFKVTRPQTIVRREMEDEAGVSSGQRKHDENPP